MSAMVARPAVEDQEVGRSKCWCCGAVDEPARMVHLGDHPEVQVCVRCAHWAAKRAAEIEDRGKSGPLVASRNWLREGRRHVMNHGWQHSRLLGRPLRWLGKRLP